MNADVWIHFDTEVIQFFQGTNESQLSIKNKINWIDNKVSINAYINVITGEAYFM